MNPAPGLPFIRIRMPEKMLRMVFLLAFGSLLSACQEPTAGVSIVGYNHTIDRSIYTFTVDGRMGSNLRPESGGGKFSCCVDIPKTWRPGLKVRIRWEYQGGTAIPPPPPPQEAEVDVDVPAYTPQDLGRLAVHFYPDHQVAVVVTRMSIDHRDYPAALKWDAPIPKDAVRGHALPEPPPAVNYEELLNRAYQTPATPATAASSTSPAQPGSAPVR
ncbi:MAG: DUF3304 domain-containing protein [Polaromonas sp.]|nr:DUF3304 domain-containing protein [Polaromonas sp.]